MKNDNNKNQFYIEYFKEMRNEINTRIKTHTQFVNWKIISIGGIFSFLIKMILDIDEKEAELLILVIGGFAFLPMISMLFDSMIAKNINNIHKLGCFIKHKIESDILKEDMWEKFIGQSDSNPENRCYNKLDVEILSLFTKLVIIVSFIGSVYCVISPIIEIKNFEFIIIINEIKRSLWILMQIEIIIVLVVYIFYFIRYRKYRQKMKELITATFDETEEKDTNDTRKKI